MLHTPSSGQCARRCIHRNAPSHPHHHRCERREATSNYHQRQPSLRASKCPPLLPCTQPHRACFHPPPPYLPSTTSPPPSASNCHPHPARGPAIPAHPHPNLPNLFPLVTTQPAACGLSPPLLYFGSTLAPAHHPAPFSAFSFPFSALGPSALRLVT